MRSLFIAAAVGGMAVLFACSSTETKYQRGQVWSYKASASTDSHITVLDVHRDAQYGEVVFIAMDGLNISTSDGLEIHAVHSIPFSRAALDLSVAALLRTGQGHESVRPADIEGVPYEEWKQNARQGSDFYSGGLPQLAAALERADVAIRFAATGLAQSIVTVEESA